VSCGVVMAGHVSLKCPLAVTRNDTTIRGLLTVKVINEERKEHQRCVLFLSMIGR
jgi:hypothetical protein